VLFAGHFLFLDGRETTFPSRFTTAVLAAVEILNYTLTHGDSEAFGLLAADLEALLAGQPRFFDAKQPYAYCYR
jgi:hypothetical protein